MAHTSIHQIIRIPRHLRDKTRTTTAIRALHHWQYQDDSSNWGFHSRLFELMEKADADNLMVIAKAYPYEVIAYRLWKSTANKVEFFRAYGIESRGAEA